MAQLFPLSSVALPPALGLRRDLPPRTVVKSEAFWDYYDSETLLYDATIAADGTVSLYAPKLLNLRPLLDTALAALAPQLETAPSYTLGRHHDRIRFRLRDPSPALALQLGEERVELPLNTLRPEQFRGLDVIYTMNRNNDLDWVRDWMRWYRNAHGATGAIVTDNGSTAYGPGDLLEAMAGVPGYRAVGVLLAPLPYGPRAPHCTNQSKAKFLQASLINLVRDRFLSEARVMLNADTDELVVGRGGASVFDAIARSPFGFMTFGGRWRHARVMGPVRHADHVYLRPDDAPCPTKYGLRPQSFIGQRFLQVHSVANIDRNLFRSRRRFHYLHCRQVSTSWKYDRRLEGDKALVHDPEAEALFARCLPSEEVRA